MNVLSCNGNVLSCHGHVLSYYGNVLSCHGNVLSCHGNVLSLSDVPNMFSWTLPFEMLHEIFWCIFFCIFHGWGGVQIFQQSWKIITNICICVRGGQREGSYKGLFYLLFLRVGVILSISCDARFGFFKVKHPHFSTTWILCERSKFSWILCER